MVKNEESLFEEVECSLLESEFVCVGAWLPFGGEATNAAASSGSSEHICWKHASMSVVGVLGFDRKFVCAGRRGGDVFVSL